jgi:acetyltransferase-like isoleucine patch superfamily enzyme
LRLLGLDIGSGCRFNGLPIVTIARGAKIKIGKNVLLNSSETSNSVGLPHRVILDARTSESVIEIGDHTGISGASIVAQTSVKIGRHVMIGGGAGIWDTDFHPIDLQKRLEHPTRNAKSAPIVIEDGAFIGARAVILKGVTIGRGAVVGAAAVVSKDVKPGEIVAGNPAKVIGHIDNL